MNYINDEDIIHRSRDLSRTNLLFIFGIIKAASIGLAVTVFLQIFIELGPFFSIDRVLIPIPILLKWVASYLCLLVTFDAAMFATLFLIHIPKRSESFFTFLLVGTEALQFGILSPTLIDGYNNHKILSVTLQDWWYVIFAFYSLFMLLLVWHGEIVIKKNEKNFSLRVSPILSKYLNSFKKAKAVLIISILFSLFVFILLIVEQDENNRMFMRVFSTGICIGMVFFSFQQQHKQRVVIEEDFNKISANKYANTSRRSLTHFAKFKNNAVILTTQRFNKKEKYF